MLCTIPRRASRQDPFLPLIPTPPTRHLIIAIALARAWPGPQGTQAPGLCLPFLSVLAPGDRWELRTMAGTKYSKDGI